MKPFWKSSNFWTNVLAVFASIFTGIEAQQLIEAAGGVADAVFAQNFQIIAVVTASISFFNILWHLVFKKKESVEEKVVKVLEAKGVLPPGKDSLA